MDKYEIKTRTLLGSPLEQLREAGRSIKNLTSLEHYKAIPKFIHAGKKGIGNNLVLNPGWLFDLEILAFYAGTNFSVFGIAPLILNPITYNLIKTAVNVQRTLSLKKENLESLVKISDNLRKQKKPDSSDFGFAFDLFTRNEFNEQERKEIETLYSEEYVWDHYKNNYFKEVREQLAGFKHKEVRELAFAKFLKSGSIYSKEIYNKIDSAEDSTSRELAMIHIGKKSPYSDHGSTDFFLENKFNSEDKEMYELAVDSVDCYASDLKLLKELIARGDEGINDSLKKYFRRNSDSRGNSSIIFFLNTAYNDCTSNPDIRSLTELVLAKGSREFMSDTLFSIKNMSKTEEGRETARVINNYGKKKKIQAMRGLASLMSLYGHDCLEILTNKLKQEKNNDLIEILGDMNRHITDYFQIDGISDSLTKKDISYLIRGYNNTRDVPESKYFIGAVLRGDSLWDYRKSIDDKFSEGINPGWIGGYRREVSKKIKVNVRNSNIAYENYAEAIKHLKEEGMDVELKEDYFEHARILIKEISEKNQALIKDAREHLQIAMKHHRDSEIEAEKIIYRTGNLKDFAFIGEYPQETCLNLSRSNSKYTIGMAKNKNILPFLVSTEYSGHEVILKRGFLRCFEDKLIVDDLYGAPVDFVKEAAMFACTLEKEIVIPTEMMSRLTQEDQKYVQKHLARKEIREFFRDPVYSDSAGYKSTRGNVECKYGVYLGEPCPMAA
jgi:hypothetical protein